MAIHERETVILDSGDGGAGMIAGISVVALVVLGLFLVFEGAFNSGTGGTIDVDVPVVSADLVSNGQ